MVYINHFFLFDNNKKKKIRNNEKTKIFKKINT